VTFVLHDREGVALVVEAHAGLVAIDHAEITRALALRCARVGCAAGIAFTPALAYCVFDAMPVTERVRVRTFGWLGGTRVLFLRARIGDVAYGTRADLFPTQVRLWIKRLAAIGRDVFETRETPSETSVHAAMCVVLAERLQRCSLRQLRGLLPLPEGAAVDVDTPEE